MMNDISFRTVTDVACNKGYYAMYAAKRAQSVVGFDVDVQCVHEATKLAKKRKANAIFAVKNVNTLVNCKLHENLRFYSDLVLALAIVHHLNGVVKPKAFARGLSNISNKYILIEDINSAKLYKDEFVKLGFELIRREESYPLPRSLSLYRRK